jgi:2,3-bisphosphoglycerate-independent phosphoglycerate mutase
MNNPVLLCILDGWGMASDHPHNAISQAHTPCWDSMLREYPSSQLDASGHSVGLPEGQMGNSEVGHMTMGAGRVVAQDLPRMDAAFRDHKQLEDFPRLLAAVESVKPTRKRLHLMGLLSDGGVHSHIRHFLALIDLTAKQNVELCLHVFLDGRDTMPGTAPLYLEQLMAHIAPYPHAKIATIAGRFYAMDRDKRYDRTQLAYEAIVAAQGQVFTTIDALFVNQLTDEFVLPTVLPGYAGMQDGDAMVMVNFRSDRVRQLLSALLVPEFDGFARFHYVRWAAAVGMVEYAAALTSYITSLFPTPDITETLGELLARHHKTQLRIAETEKYAHVTFFFNGGREEPFVGEDRVLVPSPAVRTYDLQPEMSAPPMTEQVVQAILARKYDAIILNYANADMVGHTGDFAATVKAIEALDRCLAAVKEAILQVEGALLITADHGNAEQMRDHHTHHNHTAHTLNPVPCVLVSAQHSAKTFRLHAGQLSDIAPTMLALLQLPQPASMTGHSLIDKKRPYDRL